MLSYQHAYHAGNHADILKHYVLSFVISSLNKKDKPYTFIDTHAGSGLYDLLDNRSLKTGESEKGILKLISSVFTEDEKKLFEETSFSDYISLIKSFTDKNNYPGSPLIEYSLLRSQDTLVLSELHPQEVENLRNNLTLSAQKNKAKYLVNNKDGFTVLNSQVPPVTKRGAVLIDPSYEETVDYENVTKAIINVNRKWSNGIIMLWYPLLAHRTDEINNMLETITDSVKKVNANTEMCRLELCVQDKASHTEVSLEEVLADEDKKNPPRLYGSGMLVINAPWHLKEYGEALLPVLMAKLSSL